jgi:CelD/BcsL family acetyltransferase involved in cellulose biosynthesis
MNVVGLHSPAAESRTIPATDWNIARIDVFEDLAGAEPHWRALEQTDILATPYQRFDFLKLWHHHLGSAAGVTPFIIVGFNAIGTPLFLWPFGRRAVGSSGVIEFLGGKHVNFNMGLWRREVAAKVNAHDLRVLLNRFTGRADIVKLINQPLTWAGTTNPFALLPQQRSANFGFSGPLIPHFDTLLRVRTNAATRKKIRKKERILASYGAIRFEKASGATEVHRVLDAFFTQKNARMRFLGIQDIFATPGVRRFIEAAATETFFGDEAPIELYALSVDDIIVATMGGVVGGGRFCAMFNSIVQGHLAIVSPGEQLIVNLVRICCERGLETFDLGIGEAHYKNLFCGDSNPLFDSYLPLSVRGHLLAFAFAIAAAIKRAIKQHSALWPMVCAMRRLRARLFTRP